MSSLVLKTIRIFAEGIFNAGFFAAGIFVERIFCRAYFSPKETFTEENSPGKEYSPNRLFAERIFRHQNFRQLVFSPKVSWSVACRPLWRRWYQNTSIIVKFFHLHYSKIKLITYSKKFTRQRTIDNVTQMKTLIDECSNYSIIQDSLQTHKITFVIDERESKLVLTTRNYWMYKSSCFYINK